MVYCRWRPDERFAPGQTFESLRDDLMRLYAVIRSPEMISEASRLECPPEAAD